MGLHLDPSATGQFSVLAALTACALSAVTLLLGAWLSRSGSGVGRWPPVVAGGLLAALVAFDLLPDLIADLQGTIGAGRSAMVALVALVTAGVGFAAGALLLLRRRGDSLLEPAACCAPSSGRLTAIGLAGHGAAEGLVVGLGMGLDRRTGAVLLGAFALHRLAEGFALGTALRRSRSRSPLAWLLIAAAAPAVGGAVGMVLQPAAVLQVMLAGALGGLLTAVALSLVLSGLAPRSRPTGVLAS